MKILAVYYSKSGRTQQVMERVCSQLPVDRVISISTVGARTGIGGFFKSARESISNANAEIFPIVPPLNAAEYDLVILGTPVWAGAPSSPLATFVRNYGKGIKKAAYVITSKSNGRQTKVIETLDALCGIKCCAELCAGKSDDLATISIDSFVSSIKSDGQN